MIKVFFIILISCNMPALGTSAETPTSEQIGKILSAVWKSLPQSMDITYSATFEDNTKTEEELRRIYEEAYDNLYGSKAKLSNNLLKDRETTVQKNVKNFIKEQQEGGQKVSFRVRFDLNYYRLDRTWDSLQKNIKTQVIQNEKIIDHNMPYQFSFIEVTEPNGIVERFEIYNDTKTSSMKKIDSNKKQDITQLPILTFLTMPNSLLLKLYLGDSIGRLPKDPIEVNEIKVDKMFTGKLKGINISVSSDEEMPDKRDKIEIYVCSKEDINKPILESILVCDRNDYSKVYYYTAKNPSKNELVYTRTCDDFDAKGIPHRVIETKFGPKNKINFRDTYKIQDIKIDIPIPKETFYFNPPDDYEIVNIDSNGRGRVIREKGGFEGSVQKFSQATKTKDVEKLKELLKNESPKIRFMSLQVLDQLLTQDKQKLKEAALILENDNDPIVRQEAMKILSRYNE